MFCFPCVLDAFAGDKSEAKALMNKAGVPVVPGYHGADQSNDRSVDADTRRHVNVSAPQLHNLCTSETM